MSLSLSEVGAVVTGLLGGYWLVSRFIGGREKSADKVEEAKLGASGDGEGESNGVSLRKAPRPWWVILGVPQIATRDEILIAYRRKISSYHPDKVAQMGDEIRELAEHHAKEINTAYEEALRRN